MESVSRRSSIPPHQPEWDPADQVYLWVRYVVPLLGLYLIVRPLLSLVVQSAVAIAGSLLDHIDSLEPALLQLSFLPIDKIYASVTLRVLGNVQVVGIGVAGNLGMWLHNLAPQVFTDPPLVAQGAWVSAILVSGSSVLAVFASRVFARLALFSAGAIIAQSTIGADQPWFLGHHLPRRRLPFLLGILIQAESLAGLAVLGATLSEADLEVMGFDLLATKLLAVTPLAYESFIGTLAHAAVLGAVALAVVVISVLVTRPWRCRRPGASAGHSGRHQRPALPGTPLPVVRPAAAAPRYHSLLLLAVGVAVALSPANTLAPGRMTEVSAEPPAIIEKAETDIAAPLPTPPAVAVPMDAAKRTGSLVAISGRNYQHSLWVNGVPQVLRGVGYNPTYRQLGETERAAMYDRDFRMIAASGFNAVLGWNQDEFDEVTLRKANEYGLGVLMPFDLPASANYNDPATTARLKKEIAAWVERHKTASALRMWAIGNEVYHDMKDRGQIPAFTRFYAEVVSMVHELDPAHPVLYRDAEDAFVGLLRDAFKEVGARRYWLVYGMNIFTYRMESVLSKWPEQGMDVALLVSEFGPTGLNRDARPGGYLRMWKAMQKEPGRVLGGFAYVWSTNGPEALDRTYGLVNEKGEPTDASLATLSSQFWREIEARSGAGEP